MNEERSLWISHQQKIVSFKFVEGFERMIFPSRKEKFDYAVKISATGYRIQ